MTNLSLLIVRCPLKPLTGSIASTPQDWQDVSCAEQFEWALCEKPTEGVITAVDDLVQTATGLGTTESLPYAEEALILMPTLDVRLIKTKVPLANAKKLQQVLPTLIEEHLLGGVESIAVQALPLIPGEPALVRTLAVVDRTWFAWLTKQLEGLLCQRVRLIPDCLVLDLSTIVYTQLDHYVSFTQRTGPQTGVAWVENGVAGQVVLPQRLVGMQTLECSWEVLIRGAKYFLSENTSSRSANFALNLLPKTFKQHNPKTGIRKRLLGQVLRQDTSDARPGMSWLDPLIWRQVVRWATYCVGTIAIGFVLHLSWLFVDVWRWNQQMEVLAAQALSPAAIATLSRGQAVPLVGNDSSSVALKGGAILPAFVKQVTQEQRRQGLVTDADFVSMTAKLQQLKTALGIETLVSVNYDGYGIDFECEPTQVKRDVVQTARSLGFWAKSLGVNRYRLESYAGLGVGS